jgi:hypothetical protein
MRGRRGRRKGEEMRGRKEGVEGGEWGGELMEEGREKVKGRRKEDS